MKINFNSTNKYFDYKIGLAGGLVMGIIVFYINYSATAEITGSFTAAMKQGIYTFFFGGSIMKICEIVATRVSKKNLALILATIIPSFISLALTFGLHSLKGTPRPVESTIPTAIFVIPSTAVWGYLKRKKLDKTDIEKVTQ
jgi:hypothetical protein